MNSLPEHTNLRISWASDIHFDHANPDKVEAFFLKLRKQNPEVLLLAGDIDLSVQNPVYSITGETIPANGLISTLKKIKENVDCKIFFILGNHDFYFSSFKDVRSSAEKLTDENLEISYIHETEGIPLDSETALVGHDGWADSRSGQFWNSDMTLMDFFHIQDLKVEKAKQIFTPQTKKKMEVLGDESARYAEKILPKIFKIYKRAIFLTHVPPFREASHHIDAICDDKSAPFFVNQALGESLTKIMKKHPNNHLTVLCGHTHTSSVYQPRSNLVVLTAGAEYGDPEPQDPLFL